MKNILAILSSLKGMLNKLRYKYYSRYYKNVSKENIIALKNLTTLSKIYLGRQNGKTILTIRWNYIYYVENYNFKIAKMILKKYKKYLV